MLLCTDLHAENILSAEREPWLVIDPKSHVGDPTYDVLQHILNCDGRLLTEPRAGVANGRAPRLGPRSTAALALRSFAQEAADSSLLAEVAAVAS